ncbi:unnamed protein product, partial [Mesorhabditis belari]|uniref:VWFA domain-containing protein n=1 Tax=Mesorhabditis belari TaxID=2138241 RepID=A0AAF3J4R8_9BILA
MPRRKAVDKDEVSPAAAKRKTTKTKPDNANVIVIDAGKNMEGEPFHDTIQTVEWLLTRKIMRSKSDADRKTAGGMDLFGIVVFGCDETDNPLGTEGVLAKEEVLQMATFDQMRFLSELSPSQKTYGDYAQGLIVALDWLKRRLEDGGDFDKKNLILFTNALGNRDRPTHRTALEVIASVLAAMDVELHVVGLTDPPESHSVTELKEFVAENGGSTYDYSNVGKLISKLSAYQQLTRLNYFQLEIAKDIKLNFKCINYISKARSDKEERMRAVDPRTLKAVHRQRHLFTVEETSKEDGASGDGGQGGPSAGSSSYGFGTFRPTGPNGAAKDNGFKKEEAMDEGEGEGTQQQKEYTYTQVNPEDKAYGYVFGSSKLIMDKETKDSYNLSFNYNRSSVFQLICTVPENAIHPQYMAGTETRVFVPDTRKGAQPAAGAFVEGLLEAKAVAIVRFAFNAIAQPTLVALKPRIHPEYNTPMLYGIRLPFADDIRHTMFPPLEKIDPIKSIEKLDLIDELIDNFMAEGEGALSNSHRQREAYLKRNQLIFEKVGVRTSVIKAGERELTETQKNIIEHVRREFPIVDYKAMKAAERENERQKVAEVDVDALLAGNEEEEEQEDLKPMKADLDAKVAKSAGDEKKGMSLFLKEQFAHIIVNASDSPEEINLNKLQFARSWCIRTAEPKLFNDLMGKLRNLDDIKEWAARCTNPALRPITTVECEKSEVNEEKAKKWWIDDEDDDDDF